MANPRNSKIDRFIDLLHEYRRNAMQHTSGPWRYEGEWAGEHIISRASATIGEGEYLSASGVIFTAKMQVSNNPRRDMQLVASAPELLVMLRKVLSTVGASSNPRVKDMCQDIKDLIHRATGGSEDEKTQHA